MLMFSTMPVRPDRPAPGFRLVRNASRFLAACALCTGMAGAPAFAQEEGAAPTEEAPAAKAKPKPSPKPKPKPKPAAKPVETEPAAPATTPAANLAPVKPAEMIVVCDGGQAALYEGQGAVSLWVTRSGLVTVDNPLRPLTPETTRVLQVIIGGKIATAFGPDLSALRRGGTPAALEATLGGPVRWDGELTVLPDILTIVSEAGEVLARLDHRRCGEAPEVKATPVAKTKVPPKDKPKPAARVPRPGPSPGASEGSGAGGPPRGLQLPQGAIPSGTP